MFSIIVAVLFVIKVLTLVSPVSSTGIRDNNIIYITPTMILYEDIKPIENVLLHPICVLSHLMCPCKLCNIKLSFHYWTRWSFWWICHLKIDLTRFFIITPGHPGRPNQAGLGEKKRSGALVTRGKTPTTVTWGECLKIYCCVIVAQ